VEHRWLLRWFDRRQENVNCEIVRNAVEVAKEAKGHYGTSPRIHAGITGFVANHSTAAHRQMVAAADH
jgi:hypothetical protein